MYQLPCWINGGAIRPGQLLPARPVTADGVRGTKPEGLMYSENLAALTIRTESWGGIYYIRTLVHIMLSEVGPVQIQLDGDN